MQRLIRQRGAAEYQALKDEVTALAERFANKGFRVEGPRVSLQGCQIQFGPGISAKPHSLSEVQFSWGPAA
jgi:hypothetical protein